MADPVPDLLAALRKWSPEEERLPSLEGAVDPHRSDDVHLLFALDPCRGPWIRVPAGAVAAVHRLRDVRCGAAAFPGVRMELDPDAPGALTVVDALRAGLGASGPAAGSPADGALLGGEAADQGTSHDVRVEVRPNGKLYRIRLQVEGHEVRRVDWDAERKVYTAEVLGLPLEDALDVFLQAWGSDGATLIVTVEVDGRALSPPLEVRVTDRPGEARRSYRL